MFEVFDGLVVHSVKEETPFVEPVTEPGRGIAKPSVSLKDIPKTDVAVSLLQNSPKSNPFPANPTVESAIFALSTFAKYAYQFPSVAWTILKVFPLIVTSGSPLPSSVSDKLESLMTTSTTIEPEKWLSNWEFSADTNKFGLLDASASSTGINIIKKDASKKSNFICNVKNSNSSQITLS